MFFGFLLLGETLETDVLTKRSSVSHVSLLPSTDGTAALHIVTCMEK